MDKKDINKQKLLDYITAGILWNKCCKDQIEADNLNCAICNKEDHYAIDCPFNGMSNFIKELNL